MVEDIKYENDEQAAQLVHVMNRGNGKQIIYEQRDDYEFFVSRLIELKEEMKFDVLAYCLMKNHFHLLIRINAGELPGLMQRLETGYAAYYNKKYEHAGHVFQGRYQSNEVATQRHLEACVRYIHNNPVEAGICARENYFWSSYRAYIGVDRNSGWLDVAKTIDLLGGSAAFTEISKSSDKKYEDCKFADCVTKGELYERARRLIGKELGREVKTGDCVKELSVERRNAVIKRLKEEGLSQKDVELLTGVSKYIIARC